MARRPKRSENAESRRSWRRPDAEAHGRALRPSTEIGAAAFAESPGPALARASLAAGDALTRRRRVTRRPRAKYQVTERIPDRRALAQLREIGFDRAKLVSGQSLSRTPGRVISGVRVREHGQGIGTRSFALPRAPTRPRARAEPPFTPFVLGRSAAPFPRAFRLAVEVSRPLKRARGEEVVIATRPEN